jgi:ubiquinone/menaquinone biosynthesis C-methylase UbiE
MKTPAVPELHVNYRFVVDFCLRNARGGKILDYGCGSGEIVRAVLAENLDVYGCETFYAGSHGVKEHVADLLGTRIFEINEGRIPFPDSTFDCVVNNQVFEHVEDIDAVLSEIRRVLKPGGALLSMFPSIEVLREGHCGVPLAHRFAKYPRLGYYWLLSFRTLGFGYHHKQKSRSKWASDFRQWLTDYCDYRPEQEVMAAFERHGLKASGIEDRYIQFRNLKFFTPWMMRRLGGMVLLSHKA